MGDISRFRDFIQDMTHLADEKPDEAAWLEKGQALLGRLLAVDDWLPEKFGTPGETFQQFLLYCDPLERFSVVSFVWGPGQVTPIHNHVAPGMVGALRGGEISTEMLQDPAGGPMRPGRVDTLTPGKIVPLSIAYAYDIHTARNLYDDRPSVTIHVYAANIGAVERASFDAATSKATQMVTGYTNDLLPNLWDRRPALVEA